MNKRKAAASKTKPQVNQSGGLVILAEGYSHTDLRGIDSFVDLWKQLYRLAGGQEHVVIKGFSKDQFIQLNPPSSVTKYAFRREGLDTFIARIYAETKFTRLLIAFDEQPHNQHLSLPCLRTEVNFLLGALSKITHIPNNIRKSAHSQLSYYRTKRKKTPRSRPRQEIVEIIYMPQTFESLLLADEANILRAMGLASRPKDWPNMRGANVIPMPILEAAVKFATDPVRRKIRGTFQQNRHV